MVEVRGVYGSTKVADVNKESTTCQSLAHSTLKCFAAKISGLQ